MLDKDLTYIIVALMAMFLIGYGENYGVLSGTVIFIANLFAYTWSEKNDKTKGSS